MSNTGLFNISTTRNVTISYNKKNKGGKCFTLTGGERDATVKTALSITDIAEIIELHKMGAFDFAVDNNSTEKTWTVGPRLLPPSIPLHEQSARTSDDDSSSSSSSSTRSTGSAVYQAFLKQLKAERDWTHKQAQDYVKTDEGKRMFDDYKKSS